MNNFSSALVAGASGFIGSALVRRLAGRGIKVYCLVRPNTDRWRLAGITGLEPVEVRSFETAELGRALAGISADAVFNLASYGVDEKDRDPDLMTAGNVGVVGALLQATAAWPLKRFVHTGSCSEYGAPEAKELLAEDRRLNPLSLYGAAKAASVLYGNALAMRLGVPFVTLRPFGIFGVREAPYRLIPYLVEHLQRDEPVDLTPGEQARDLLYIDDAVDAFLAAADCEELPLHTAYNICSSNPVRIRDVAETVARLMKRPLALLQFGKRDYRADEAMWVVGDNRRFKTSTGWRPQVGLEEGIRRMFVAPDELES